MRRRDARGKGIRGIGAGRKGVIRSDAQRLLLVLVYFRQYPTQEFMGILFSISQERVCELVRDLQPTWVLKTCRHGCTQAGWLTA